MAWLKRHPLMLCLGCLGIGLLLAEGGVRWLLFGGGALGARLRWPANFTDHRTDDDYWKLNQRWLGEPGPLPERLYHPELGWVAERIDAGSLRLRREPVADGRRPVLLYGSSFAACLTAEDDCFQGLLERSELGAEYVLWNYGVRGYGLDQALMLMRRTLPRHAQDDPVVVFGVQVDEDLDRCLLSLRGWPKPRLALEGGRLREPAGPIPSLAEYLAQHPLRARSWAWDGFVHGTQILPPALRRWCAGLDARAGEASGVARAILAAARDEVRALELEFFVLLLHGERYVGLAENRNWRESFAHRALDELRIPFASSKRALREDALWNGRGFEGYYDRAGQLLGHHTPLGNAVVFRALAEGLDGVFEPWGEFAPIALGNLQASRLPDGRPAALLETGPDERYRGPADLERIVVDVQASPPGASSSIHWHLDGLAHEFQALVRRGPGERQPVAVEVVARSGAHELGRARLGAQAEEVRLRVDLRGRPDLTLEFSAELGQARLYLARPSFR